MKTEKRKWKSIFTKCIVAIWGVSLVVQPINCSARDSHGPNRPGGWNDSETGVTSVDHIDIGVDLTAVLNVNGETVQTEFTIGTGDAQYVSISANPSDTVFSVSGGVSTSTDNSGNKQIRIEGDFPVGTTDAPVEYTVTLAKRIAVNGVEVPVTLSTSTNYWDLANVCPGFTQNPGKQSGIDLKLNNGTGVSTTKGTLQIQKTISGTTPKVDTTYFFRILDAAGSVYKNNIEVKIPAGCNMSSIILTNMDLGSYSIEEVSSYSDMEGMVLNETKYEPANTFSLRSDSGNSAVNVTSTFALPREEENSNNQNESSDVEEPETPESEIPESLELPEESETPENPEHTGGIEKPENSEQIEDAESPEISEEPGETETHEDFKESGSTESAVNPEDKENSGKVETNVVVTKDVNIGNVPMLSPRTGENGNVYLYIFLSMLFCAVSFISLKEAGTRKCENRNKGQIKKAMS